MSRREQGFLFSKISKSILLVTKWPFICSVVSHLLQRQVKRIQAHKQTSLRADRVVHSLPPTKKGPLSPLSLSLSLSLSPLSIFQLLQGIESRTMRNEYTASYHKSNARRKKERSGELRVSKSERERERERTKKNDQRIGNSSVRKRVWLLLHQ